jgi:MGT family glycosyltransferase
MKHIMFVSLPLRGHANQMIALAQELATRGNRVSFVIPEEARGWITHPNVDFIAWELETANKDLDDNAKSVWKEVSSEPSIWHGEIMMLNELIKCYIPIYKTLIPIFEQHSPDLLVIDRAVIPGMDLAQTINLPYIIQTRFLGNFVKTTSKYPRFGTPYSINMSPWQRCLNFLRPLWQLPFLLSGMKKLNQVRSHCVGDHKLSDPFSEHLMIVGSAFGFEIPRELPSWVKMVGPIFPNKIEPLSPSLNQWLEDANKNNTAVIYIAFGTLANIESWQAQELVKGLINTGCKILWSLPKSQHPILPPLPDSFRIEDFVPQRTVLSHPAVRLFVSHCGMNSINEALYWAKPILALPFFGDQHYNAARLVDLGTALKLDKKHFDSTEIQSKVNTLLNISSYENAANQMSEILKSTGGLNQAADIVETMLAGQISEFLPTVTSKQLT